MKKLAVVIVSSGRADSLFERFMTPYFISRFPWFLYVPSSELPEYTVAAKDHSKVTVLPIPAGFTYHQSLDYAVASLYTQGFDVAFILDDDRSMTYWDDQSVHVAPRANPYQVESAVYEMLEFSSMAIPLIGCRLRGFCWNDNTPFTLAGKCVGMQMLYLPAIVNRFKFEWKAMSMHDHHMLAQLLRAGYLTLTYNKLLHDDRFGHMAPSGCGQWRTVRMHSEAAHMMEREFPEAVRSRLKSYINGEPLYDIVFTAARLLNLKEHIRIFGDQYLKQIRPFLNEKQGALVNATIQNCSVR